MEMIREMHRFPISHKRPQSEIPVIIKNDNAKNISYFSRKGGFLCFFLLDRSLLMGDPFDMTPLTAGLAVKIKKKGGCWLVFFGIPVYIETKTLAISLEQVILRLAKLKKILRRRLVRIRK